MKYKIERNTVQETLILPLYSRKLCSELYPNLYRDETAVRLIDKIDYDFSVAEKNSRSLMQRFGALEVAMRQRDLAWEVRDSLKTHLAKVYFDITKQPVLEIAEGSQTEMVLSVGMDKLGIPLITISNDGNPICYRLPEELSDWTYTAIGMANMGENLFPSQVVFTKEKNRYFADIW